MPKTHSYLVAIHATPPKPRTDGVMTHWVSTNHPAPRVVQATSPREAGEKVNPPAGSRVYVARLDDVSQFVMPARARLEAA